VKFETRTLDDGRVQLQLGLSSNVTFEEDVALDSVIFGVDNLLKQTLNVSPLELVEAVVKEFEKKDG